MKFVLLAIIISSFIPLSIATPAGYLGPVDVPVLLGTILAIIKLISGQVRIDQHSLKVFLLSTFVFIGVFTCQIISGNEISINDNIKYATFIIILPFIVFISKHEFSNSHLYKSLPQILSSSGLILAILSIFEIAMGNYITSGGGAYYVLLFGQQVHKNFLGVLLLFGSISAGWCTINEKRTAHLFSLMFQVFVTIFIGNRSAVLVESLFISILILKARKDSRYVVALMTLIIAGLTGSIIALASGLLQGQVDRLMALLNVNDRDLTTASARFWLWSYAWDLIVKKPLFGYGFGNFLYVAHNWLSGRDQPHNAVLQIVYAVGFVGAFLFSILLYFGYAQRNRGSYEVKLFATLVAADLVNGMVGIVWIRGEGHLFWTLFFMLAMRYGQIEPRRRRSRPQKVPHIGRRNGPGSI